MQVIQGGKLINKQKKEIKRKKLEDIFERCFYEEYYLREKQDLYKICFYGVRWCVLKSFNTQNNIIDLRIMLLNMQLVCEELKKLTYNEFIMIFPIDKYYDYSKKFQSKDYFCVKESLSHYDMNSVIGENLTNFLWEYSNFYTGSFICKMLAMQDLYNIKVYGNVSALEMFFNSLGVEPTKLIKDTKTGKFYDSKTGEEIEMSKPTPRKPKYMKPIEIIKNKD